MNDKDNEYNLPYRTEEILKAFDPMKNCENLGLLLDKCMPKRIFDKPSPTHPRAGKAFWLLDIFKHRNENDPQSNNATTQFSRNVYQRWRAMMQSLGAKLFDLPIDWRMIVGLGGETVLETDLALHHLYGIPIIPGSALKGLTRAYVAKEYKSYYVPEDQPEEERHASKSIKEDHSEIKRIFGKQEVAGTVCFFDAMPLHGQAQFVVDIMNPHYPDYYRSLQSNSIKASTNDQQPNPVTFLTVTNTTFTFALAPRQPKYTDDVDKVKKWLQEALQIYGVGGKTSAGYGYFKAVQTYTRPDNLPQFHEGDTIRGTVLDERTNKGIVRYIESGQASKCLQFLTFPIDQVLILISSEFEEAKQWKTRNTSICQFIEERIEDNRVLLICKPKKKNK